MFLVNFTFHNESQADQLETDNTEQTLFFLVSVGSRLGYHSVYIRNSGGGNGNCSLREMEWLAVRA